MALRISRGRTCGPGERAEKALREVEAVGGVEFEVARGEVPSDHHRDPFYPILVFQAVIEEMSLLGGALKEGTSAS
jgi:hypothetical protein